MARTGTESSRTEKRLSRAEAESRRLWRLAAMGGTMASEILAGLLIGWGLDILFRTSGRPLMITGTVVGVVVGLTTFIRSAVAESRKASREAGRIAHRLETGTDDDDGTGSDP
jgi:F0F1-type ATP synthase assembly protein I